MLNAKWLNVFKGGGESVCVTPSTQVYRSGNTDVNLRTLDELMGLVVPALIPDSPHAWNSHAPPSPPASVSLAWNRDEKADLDLPSLPDNRTEVSMLRRRDHASSQKATNIGGGMTSSSRPRFPYGCGASHQSPRELPQKN